jgi:hypothetical protein
MSDYIAYTPGKTPWLSLDYRTAARTALEDYQGADPVSNRVIDNTLHSALHYLHVAAIPQRRNPERHHDTRHYLVPDLDRRRRADNRRPHHRLIINPTRPPAASLVE